MWPARIQLAAPLLLFSHLVRAGPISTASYSEFDNSTFVLQERSCTSPSTLCGYYGTACCASNEVCYTDPTNDQASCSVTTATAVVTAAPTYASGGSWVYWTSTYVQTNLVTYYSTYSSYVSAVPAATAPPQTTANAVTCPESGQTSCGPICCASWQYCLVDGQCAARASSLVQQTVYTTPYTSYNSYTAPLRPTSVGTQTVTSTISPTTTVGFEPAVETGANVTITSTTSNSGLSGGAIAGIVIGVILGLIILILICLCICAGEALAGILAFFGIGGNKKDRRRTTEEVEYYNRHGSRADGRSWYGSGRRPPPKKKESGIGWLTLAAGGLAAFWAALTFGRKRRNDEKSEASYTSYGSGYSSSARRTEDSRRPPPRR